MLGYGVKPIQATTTIDLIYWLTEDLGCMVASCDPSVRNFNSTIGFAYNETVSPLDNMINDFLQNGRQFLPINGHKATMNFDDDHARDKLGCTRRTLSHRYSRSPIFSSGWKRQSASSFSFNLCCYSCVLPLTICAQFPADGRRPEQGYGSTRQPVLYDTR
ncbi:hypothetical protein M427DRAFT_288109 [Gonapodya prolifera JEL478]|uniref:Uncharacterized protein n=1 Tax=Gonapodya prolifera (strain JEL478) TaxID=1344416 RepID=A0A139AIG0_GONPJ|nr:hypothetical protein M427DRAFT_288109 [Gonapodya prolifera JEL478]|eukprot:KXS16596.1 hypothetical protein M427DRAFT_288109 [Gonapodya prolifera JEL478]